MKLHKWQFAIYTVLIIIFSFVSNTLYKNYILEKQKTIQLSHVQDGLAYIRSDVESDLASNLLLIRSVASYISVHPDFTSEEFQKLAKVVTSKPNSLINIAAAPDFVLTYVYPEEGNEKIKGIDYRKLTAQWPKVELAIKTRDMVIAGPLNLIQGGRGIIGRDAVYIDVDGEEKLWGLVSSVINFDAIAVKLAKTAGDYGIKIAIHNIENVEQNGGIVYGDMRLFEDRRAVKAEIAIPNGKWQMVAVPVNGWITKAPDYLKINLLFIAFTLVTIFLLYKKLQNEYALSESRKRFMDYTKSSSDWVWEVNKEGEYVYVSGKVKEIIGYEPADLLGKTPFAFMSEKEAKRVKSEFEKYFIDRKPIDDLENWIIAKDGEEICVMTSGIPIFDLNGEFKGFRGVDKDITDLVKAREALSESKELLDLFFNQSLDGFFFMMLDEPIYWNEEADKEKLLDYVFEHQRVTKVNKSMLDQYLAKEDDFIGFTPKDFFEHDISAGRKVWRNLLDEGRMKIDTVEKRFDGSSMVVTGDYICLYAKDGALTGHFGVQRDVTLERDAEENLARYVNIIDENVLNTQVDLEGNITYVSKALCDVSGYTKEELIGEKVEILGHEEMTPEIYAEIWSTIKSGESWVGETINKKKDGGIFWADTTIAALKNRDGEIYSYMSVRQDITDKKEVEKLSITDRLTGIYNRLKLDSTIQEEYQRFIRYNEPASIILFDIDHFKAVNDTYGHLIGDYVLQELSRVTKLHVRKTDVFGRWGGEEFLVICPHTNIDGALQLAEKIREEIAGHNFEHVDKITASFGVASLENTSEYDQLLKKVDDALYEAKKTGRNKVCIAK